MNTLPPAVELEEIKPTESESQISEITNIELPSIIDNIGDESEKIVSEEQLNYIDAIVHYCDTNSLEVESVTKLISKPLKERLKWDATRLNFMKRTSRAKLPI